MKVRMVEGQDRDGAMVDESGWLENRVAVGKCRSEIMEGEGEA